jgi:D-arabinose 1-dehydrogenase-like Zn-dependent alcohol dehydrogenase
VPSLLGSAVRIQGIGVGSRKDTEDVLAFLEKYRIEPVIDSVYGFADASRAFDHLDRGPFGKVVIELRD